MNLSLRTLADFDVLRRFGATLAFVDASRVAAVGHSLGAQRALAWAFQADSTLAAVVSLDSTIEYWGLEDEHFRSLQITQDRRIDIPVLRFATQMAGQAPPHTEVFNEVLKFASNYYGEVQGFRHDDYISHGASGRTLIGAADSAGTRAKYDLVCTLVLDFLDTFAARERKAAPVLEKRLVQKSNELVFRYVAPKQLPPTGRQIVRLYDEKGRVETRALLEASKGDLDEGDLRAAGELFIEQGRVAEAMVMYRWTVKLIGNGLGSYMLLAEVQAATGEFTQAAASCRKALAALETIHDGSERERSILRAQIEAELQAYVAKQAP